MMMSSLGFLFASYVPDLELKQQQPGNAKGHRQNKQSQKSLTTLAKDSVCPKPNKTEKY